MLPYGCGGAVCTGSSLLAAVGAAVPVIGFVGMESLHARCLGDGRRRVRRPPDWRKLRISHFRVSPFTFPLVFLSLLRYRLSAPPVGFASSLLLALIWVVFANIFADSRPFLSPAASGVVGCVLGASGCFFVLPW